MRHLANAQYWDRPAGGNTGRLFLAFGGPVCADRFSNCPLDRVLTYKNLIYFANLQFRLATYFSVSSEAMRYLGLILVPEVLFGILWCTPGSTRFRAGSAPVNLLIGWSWRLCPAMKAHIIMNFVAYVVCYKSLW